MMTYSREKRAKAWTKRVLAAGALVVALVMGGLLAAPPAHASTTFTVDNIGDPGDGLCNAQGCTLRDAILAANLTPNSGGPDLIRFKIPGTGVKTIQPSTELPTITDPVVINGYSQPGSSPNTLAKGTNAKLLIELDGSITRGSFFPSGLEIGGSIGDASGTVVRGLVINRFDAGIVISDTSTKGVSVAGNFVGTDPSGTSDAGNISSGVVIVGGAKGTTVGGSSPAARNLISGNGSGVAIAQGSARNVVSGNLIGTSKDGLSALANSGDGVNVTSSPKSLVGGTTAAWANTIAFNGDDGVQIVRGESTGNQVLRNSIFSNGGLGIDLVIDQLENGEVGDGRTANDGAGDPDVGPNGLQNFPVIGSAKTASAKTTIEGKLSSKANKSFVVRFFKNPSGNEGKTFIGQKKVTTDPEGKVSFTFSPAQKVGVGKTVTATATGSEGTSEFSAPRKVAAS